jgi:hypothetical protein
VNNCIRQAKESYYKTKLFENKNNPKGIWKLLKKLIPHKNKYPPRTVQPESATISNCFNNYFSTIGSKLCKSPSRPINQSLVSSENRSFHFNPLEVESIAKQLKQLQTNKAAGLDNIPGRLLKLSAPIIAPSLYICL